MIDAAAKFDADLVLMATHGKIASNLSLSFHHINVHEIRR
jgi:hypothetical protein